MDILRLAGTPRQVGRQYGEAYRSQFQAVHAIRASSISAKPHWQEAIWAMARAIESYFPRFWEELLGMAEGADLTPDDVVLNHWTDPGDACTAIAFTAAEDGPIFGRNRDGAPDPANIHFVRHVRYENGDEIVHATSAGALLGTSTSMNRHGLTLGGTSVGSVFQQSQQNPPIHAAIYEMMCACRTVEEAIRFIQRYPYLGKGYNFLLVDAQRQAAVLECACPLVQVRRPQEGQDVLFCTNTFKLPGLLHADRRTPEGRRHSELRYHYLERKLDNERVERTAGQMRALLASCGPEGGLCSPLYGGDEYETLTSFVVLSQAREFWVAGGRPCAVPYERVL